MKQKLNKPLLQFRHMESADFFWKKLNKVDKKIRDFFVKKFEIRKV